jgi:hypothetical protein
MLLLNHSNSRNEKTGTISLYDREKQSRSFFKFKPIATAENLMYIDEITLEEANSIRREAVLPKIEETTKKNQ